MKMKFKLNFTTGDWRVRPGNISPIICVDGDPQWPIVMQASGHNRAGIEANIHLLAASPDLARVAILILKEWEAPTEGVKVGELIARLSQYSKEAREALIKARIL